MGPAAISILDISFDVARVELPVAEVRSSPKIWNHLDMMRLDAARAAALARNGLRVGVGTAQAWPAIQAIIDSGGGKVFRDQMVVPRGQPLLMDIGPVPRDAAVFAFDRAGRLAGRTFEEGRFVMQLDYNYKSGASHSIDLQMALEIRTDYGVMTWERQGAVIRQVPSIDRYLFEGVGASTTLSADEFLVLGPDADQAGAYLVGNRCFLHDRSGAQYETVLFLTPRIVASEGGAQEVRRR